MNSSIWYCLCLYFLFFSLKLLIDDYYSVNYIVVERDDELYDNVTIYYLCVWTKEIKEKNELNYTPAIGNVSIRTFLNYSIQIIENKIKQPNLFRLDQSYLLDNDVCFWINKTDLENSKAVGEFIEAYYLRLYLFSPGKKLFSFDYASDKNDGRNNFYLMVYKQKIYDKRYLTSTKCFTFEDQLSSSRLNCLNRCFVQNNLDFGFYFHDDRGQVDLGRIFGRTDQLANKSAVSKRPIKELNQNLAKCLKQDCPASDCFYETYGILRVRKSYYDNILVKEKYDKIYFYSMIYRAIYSATDWWLQFFGLICLFTKTSVVGLVSLCVHLLANKLQIKPIYFRLFFPKFKIALYVLGWTYVLFQAILMFDAYDFEMRYPNRTNTLNYAFEIHPISLIICIPVELIMFNDSRIEENRNDEILANFTFEQIEQKTNSGLSEQIVFKAVYFGIQEMRFIWKPINEQVLFRNNSFDNRACLSRCFVVEIAVQETRYEIMQPIKSLHIEFRTKYWQLYLTDEGQPFTSLTNYFKGEFYILKVVHIRSPSSMKTNCIDYDEKTKHDCKTRRNCIDQCICRRYIDKHSALPLYSIIDKSILNSTSYNFTTIRDVELEIECFNLNERPDCREVYFAESFKSSYQYGVDRISINLNFEFLVNQEIEPSLIKVYLNICNLESILLGTNATTRLLAIFSFLKKLFNFRWYRVYRILIFALCFIGFSMHIFGIFQAIIKNDLVDNGFFDKMKTYRLPNIIFCIDFTNSTIDVNHKLTGKYLDDLTKELNIENIFHEVRYFDRRQRKHLNFSRKSINATKKQLLTSHFYFLNQKCFEFKLDIKFKEIDFYTMTTKNILGIYFKNAFANQFEQVYFVFRRSAHVKQLSNRFLYKLKNVHTGLYFKYEINFELFVIDREDKFEALKSPKSLFFKSSKINDAKEYLENMLSNFKGEYGLATKEIILDSGDFELEIDDELFQQYYTQIQNISDHDWLPVSLNSKQSIYNAYTQYNYGTKELNHSGFLFSISLMRRKLIKTNEDNYAKLIQSILNALSLWLNICVLDLIPYLNMALKQLNNLYHLLVQFRLKIAV